MHTLGAIFDLLGDILTFLGTMVIGAFDFFRIVFLDLPIFLLDIFNDLPMFIRMGISGVFGVVIVITVLRVLKLLKII